MSETNHYATRGPSTPSTIHNAWSTPNSPHPQRSPFVTGHLPPAREEPLRPGTKGWNRYKVFLDQKLLETSRIFHRRLVVEEEKRERAEKEKRKKEEAARQKRREEERQRRLAEEKQKQKQAATNAMDVDDDGDETDPGEEESDAEQFEEVRNINEAVPHTTTAGTLLVGSQQIEEKKSSLASKEALHIILNNMEQCVDLLYKTSAPAIMIPYLLSLTADLNDYLSGYHPDIPPTLRLLDKIDQCFHSLYEKNQLSITDKVRLKSIIQRIQLHVVNLEEQWEEEGGMEMEDEKEEALQQQRDRETELHKGNAEGDERMDEDMENRDPDDDGPYEEVEWDVEAARVFWRTFKDVGEGLKDGVDNSLGPATMGGFADVRCGVDLAI